MELQGNMASKSWATNGLVFDLLSAVDATVKSNSTSTALSSLSSELGETRMTPLAQSFQTLFSVLNQVQQSLPIEQGVVVSEVDVRSVNESAKNPLNETPLEPVSLLMLEKPAQMPNASLPLPAEQVPFRLNEVARSIAASIEVLAASSQPYSFYFEADEYENDEVLVTSNDTSFSQQVLSAVILDVKDKWLPKDTPQTNPILPNLESSLPSIAPKASSMNPWTPASLKLSAQLPIGAINHQPVEALYLVNETTASRVVQTIEVSKALDVDSQRQIYQVLRDKIQLQLDTMNQAARIRFDPPELGKVEVHVKVDGERVTIQMSATSAATREAILATSERLRAELVAQNSELSEVNISLEQSNSQQFQSQEQNEHSEQEVNPRANDLSDQDNSDVLEYRAYIARA
ncbi:flagellar hook-length control protein [Vibrio mediterranei]|uniref:flagellar hook-length control protein FliK n=1 Tax=Vibrio mediterranei TaxID=689 RepID=UPI00078640A0|nr:flagellar hook-length control protein FliK [Vibrio mediterranei]SBO10838.1 flagellar hook-length control protein [Vibrio mediterranei]